jgi:hypothetical protein
MDTEANPRPRHGGDHPIAIFITSISAAIVVAGGFGIIIEAFIVAGADLFELGQTFVLVGSVITGLMDFRPLPPCRAAACRGTRDRRAKALDPGQFPRFRAGPIAVLRGR